MYEDEIMNWQDLVDYYDNYNTTGSISYWELLILEYILQNHTQEEINRFKLTRKKIRDMAMNMLSDDKMWQEIDYTLCDVVGKNLFSEGE